MKSHKGEPVKKHVKRMARGGISNMPMRHPMRPQQMRAGPVMPQPGTFGPQTGQMLPGASGGPFLQASNVPGQQTFQMPAEMRAGPVMPDEPLRPASGQQSQTVGGGPFLQASNVPGQQTFQMSPQPPGPPSPPGLAGLYSGFGGLPSAGMGMAHGGAVHHHHGAGVHHHHYYGGAVGSSHGGEHEGRKGKHGDGMATKGHTKGRVR